MDHRRILLAASLLPAFVLLSCTNGRARLPDLAPEEVLRRAAKSVTQLETARFNLSASFLAEKLSWKAKGTSSIEGMLTDRGDQVAFTADVQANVDDPKGDYMVDGKVEMITASQNELFVFLHSINIDPPPKFLNDDVVSRFSGHWWVLESETAHEELSVATDPRLLQAQSNVIRFTEDLGTDVISGTPVYHFAVALDLEKLVSYLGALAAERSEPFDAAEVRERLSGLQGTGEFWIDADDFFIHQITWNLSGVPMGDTGAVSVSFTVLIKDHNKDMSVEVPEDAEAYMPFSLFDETTSLPLIPSTSTGDEQMIEEILRGMQDP